MITRHPVWVHFLHKGHILYKAVLFATLAVLGNAGQAADLFENGKAKEIPFRTLMQPSDTAGGYTIYPGEGKWEIEKVTSSTASGASGIPLGTVTATQTENGTLSARLFVTVNLSQGEGRSWAGTPCGPGHLVMRNRGRGREDNCMTIDAVSFNIGEKPATFLSVRLTNTAGSGRYYTTVLQLNPALLGVRDTGVGDWSEEVVKSQPHKAALIAKLTAWAEKLQDAAIGAFAFDQPKDTFKDLPSWRTLLTVPVALAEAKHGWGFLSAAADIQNKAGFKALAYSQSGEYKTRWGNAWGLTSQEAADKLAMDNCEKGRAAATPVCKLYLPVTP